MQSNSTTERADIYIRVSSTGQEENYSLGFQEQHCRDEAAERGYEVVNVYQDVHTGSQWRERPGLTELRQHLRTGEVDVVLCYALDRLSRDQTHIAVLVDLIEHHGARLELVTEEFENTAVGKFIRSAKGFAAEVEREKILTRSLDGRKARLQSGKILPGRKVKFGYQWLDEDHAATEVDDLTAGVVRRIFREYATEGKSLRAVKVSLEADGIPTPTGLTTWSLPTIRYLLMDETYTGKAVFWRNGDDPIELPDGVFPALIDVETFEAAQKQLRRNQQIATRRNANPEASLLRAGFVRCGHCDHVMSVNNGRDRYFCSNHGHHVTIGRDALDEIVNRRILWLLTEDAALAGAPDATELDDPTDELELLDRMIAQVDRKRANLTDSIMDTNDADSRNVLLTQLDQLSQRRRGLQDERAEITRHVERYRASREILDGFDEWRRKTAVIFEQGNYQDRREVLHKVGLQVNVWPVDHEPRWQIRLAILPSIVFTSSQRYSDEVTIKKMSIKELQAVQAALLNDDDTMRNWLTYLSEFPHQNAYFRTAPHYTNQTSVVNGRKQGTDINLDKLFTEQCFNLLRVGGECGIVIPSGIYTDLGSMQLRRMLFEEARVTGLFGFENRKGIFEGVHRSFKFVVLSFEKGETTTRFPASFMHHDVKDLDAFPRSIGIDIPVTLVERLSPDSLSVMEFRNEH